MQAETFENSAKPDETKVEQVVKFLEDYDRW
jgi:hypothetical protein